MSVAIRLLAVAQVSLYVLMVSDHRTRAASTTNILLLL
jgi:hypothetical protein